MIGSTFFQQVHKIIQSPAQLPNILGAALPDSSNFFMQFIAMRALFLIWLRMCVPHGGVWQNWCHFCWCASCCCSTCNTGGSSTAESPLQLVLPGFWSAYQRVRCNAPCNQCKVVTCVAAR